jgi:hypothetical protein
MFWKKNNFISLLLCFFTTFLMGQVYVFKLAGNKTDYKWSDSISKGPIIAGSNNSATQTTTDSSGYFFDGKKIKRNKEYTAKTLIGQKNKFTLSGTVTDCKTHGFIKDATIKLVCNDRRSIETTTDSMGHYFFDDTVMKSQRLYVVNVQASELTNTINNKSKRGYLSSSDKYKFNTYDSVTIKNIHADFCLIRMIACNYGPPITYFKKNSSTDFFFEDSLEEGITWIAQVMIDNPNLVFEIGGHANSNEMNPHKLSEDRAKHIRDLLIQKGIETERLIIKSYGDKKPIELFDEYDEPLISSKTSEKNRRVSIIVLRRDYVPKKDQPKPKQIQTEE